jgi:hypothetical protein
MAKAHLLSLVFVFAFSSMAHAGVKKLNIFCESSLEIDIGGKKYSGKFKHSQSVKSPVKVTVAGGLVELDISNYKKAANKVTVAASPMTFKMGVAGDQDCQPTMSILGEKFKDTVIELTQESSGVLVRSYYKSVSKLKKFPATAAGQSINKFSCKSGWEPFWSVWQFRVRTSSIDYAYCEIGSAY